MAQEIKDYFSGSYSVFLKKIIMKFFLFPVSLFFTQFASAQRSLPDSTMKEFARLTCECATLLKIDETAADKAIQNLGTCINSTAGVYESNGCIKKESLRDLA